MPDLHLTQEIYLDNHATTAVDPRVAESMLAMMQSQYANPGSVTHEAGRRVAHRIQDCKEQMLDLLGAPQAELIFTSGATESVNLALFGYCLHPKQTRRSLLIGKLEHRAVLDCAKKLSKSGFIVQSLDTQRNDPTRLDQPIGSCSLETIEQHLNKDTALVSLILGNNEIGTLQDMSRIAELCRSQGVVLHLDATQSVGKLPFAAHGTSSQGTSAQACGADLVSFSAHKFYGPKGVGGLLICNPELKLSPLIVGGGQQNNLRSGTLNSVGIVGMARALEVAVADMPDELPRIFGLRDRLWRRLDSAIEGLKLNGPMWPQMLPENSWDLDRLPGNLNVQFPKVDGQSLMLKIPSLAVSSGSACTSAEPHPSHVLTGIGLSEDQARCSLRFGIGRFNTESEIDLASELIISAYRELLHFVA